MFQCDPRPMHSLDKGYLSMNPLATVSQAHDQDAGDTDRLGRFCEWFLDKPLTTVVATGCLAILTSWVPVYLSWAWWPDLDCFATMAKEWDSGQRPYRDIMGYNFPGQVYVFWVLGKLFGFGKTAPIYALDVCLLVALGILMAAWSRRLFRKSLPGLLGFLSFLSYYASLHYHLVAQRDWHSAFFAVSGLLALQMWPGLAGRLACAMAFAVASIFRPYVILLLPAAVVQLAGSERESGKKAAGIALAVGIWLASLAAFTALMFAPLILQGLLPDFVRSISSARPGGIYATRSISSRAWSLLKTLIDLRLASLALGILVMLARWRSGRELTALTWLVAILGAMLSAPLAPIPHEYLSHPFILILCVNAAVLAGLVLVERGIRAELRLVIVALVPGMFVTGPPKYCNWYWSVYFARSLQQGQWPSEAPPGVKLGYDWSSYQQTLEYLRHGTAGETRVANLLHRPVAVCGESGRLSVFPFEAPSLVWLTMNRIHDVGTFEDYLVRATDSVVVWAPTETDPIERSGYAGGGQLDLGELTKTVRRLYEPEVRFGGIEVWRRKGEPDAGPR